MADASPASSLSSLGVHPMRGTGARRHVGLRAPTHRRGFVRSTHWTVWKRPGQASSVWVAWAGCRFALDGEVHCYPARPRLPRSCSPARSPAAISSRVMAARKLSDRRPPDIRCHTGRPGLIQSPLRFNEPPHSGALDYPRPFDTGGLHWNKLPPRAAGRFFDTRCRRTTTMFCSFSPGFLTVDYRA